MPTTPLSTHQLVAAAICLPLPALQTAHLLAMYQRHCQGPMQHFLEVASGPARHATAIAAATGAAATALDSSPDMLAYAAQLADAAGAGSRLTTLQADMAAAGWASQLAATADLAAVLLGSLAHCQDNGAALACFQELGWVAAGLAGGQACLQRGLQLLGVEEGQARPAAA